jgi:hypothetical protein
MPPLLIWFRQPL